MLLSRSVCALVASVVLVAPAVAQEAGAFSGAVVVPGGTELSMILKLEHDGDGAWTGTLSIPAQNLADIPISDLDVTEEAVSFVFAYEQIPEESRPRFALEFAGDDRLEGMMFQSGFEMQMWLDRTSDEALQAALDARRPQTPAGPFPYRTEEVTVPVGGEDGHTLAGTLTLPDPHEFDQGPYPTVIFITGSGAQDRDETIFDHKPFAVLADDLARKGIASLRCDDRGVFGSTGDPVNPTTHDFVDNAQAQVDFLTAREAVGPIGVIGHSEGGVVGPMLAADDERVGFVVMLAGTGVPGIEILVEQTAAILEASGVAAERVADAKEVQTALLQRYMDGESIEALREQIAELIKTQAPIVLTPDVLEAAIAQASAQLDIPWMRAFLKLDPAEALREVSQPVLVLNGDMDLQVLSWQNIPPIKEALGENGDVTVHVLEGLNHLFQECENGTVTEYAELTTTIEPEVLEIVSDWILERYGE